MGCESDAAHRAEDKNQLNRYIYMKLIVPLIATALIVSNDGFAATAVGESTSRQDLVSVIVAPRSAKLTEKIDTALAARGADYKPRTEHLLEDGRPRFTNRLILEDSPYLIQHAHNPVDWYPWGPEAFEAAKRQNKPVFLSIGYSTCHWCHVMERESFENIDIADVLNRNFISIKVDREQRPDVDETYMTAVQLIARHGGWPMSSFLTPDGKPFFGGTYFPPVQFRDLSLRVAALWEQRQGDLIESGKRIAQAVMEVTNRKAAAGQVGRESIQIAVRRMLENHDDFQGGFSSAPKFPHEPYLFLLLEAAERYNNKDALEAVTITLDAIARGGIHDQVAGGFHRYSTDNEWLAPHFEKMLYNQAHLGRAYLLAWRLSGNAFFKRVATQTLDYVLRDMRSPDGAFYSATDADSEGAEGVFFLWSREQIVAALSEQDAALAIELFGVSEGSNFEGGNILSLPVPLVVFAESKGLSLSELQMALDRIRERLYQVREQREHPLRDEKVITAWNGMMISTLAQAGVILDEPRYANAALQTAEFIWQHNRQPNGELWRAYLDGSSSVPASQEDYAYYAEGLLHLYDATDDRKWFERAREIADGMLVHFWDDQNGGFYMSKQELLTSMGRPRDGGSDNAMPSGNSVALRVLQMLSARSDNPDYGEVANATLAAFAGAIEQHPSGFGYMLTGADDLLQGELGARRYAAAGGIRVTVRQTGVNRITVDLDIPHGWHINSNTPLQENLIPTLLSMDGAGNDWRLGEINYPEPRTVSLGFQSEPLSLYDGKVRIHAELKPEKAEPPHMLPVKLSLQACNDRVCLPPEKMILRLPITQIRG